MTVAVEGSFLAAVPAHWTITRFGRDIRISEGQVDPREEPWVSSVLIAPNHIESNTGRLLALETAAAQGADSGKYVAKAGQVLYSKIRPGLNKVAVAPLDCLCSADIYAITPRADVDAQYLAYYMRSRPFHVYASVTADRVKMPKINREELATAPWARPPLGEQRAIVEFLDEQMWRIDTLVAKQTQLIITLRERRAAIADHAVWSGLNPATEMAPSGVDCAPSTPVHWKRTRAKALMFERDATSADGSQELLTVSHLTGITPRSQKNVNMIQAESHEGYRLVEAGDLVINTMWAWMGALGVSAYAGMVSPAYGVYAFRDRSSVAPEYFDGLFRSKQFVTEATRYSRGIWTSRLRLYPESFLRLAIVVPPLHEQQQIASHIQGHSRQIDALIAKTEHHIALAKERRAALTTAAVTGQIDVRTAGRTTQGVA